MRLTGFFFYLNQIEHAIESGLVCTTDVLPTLKPYLDRLDINSVRPTGDAEDSRLPVKHIIDDHSYSGIASLKRRPKTPHVG